MGRFIEVLSNASMYVSFPRRDIYHSGSVSISSQPGNGTLSYDNYLHPIAALALYVNELVLVNGMLWMHMFIHVIKREQA